MFQTDSMSAAFSAGSGRYTVSATIGELPLVYASMTEHATLHDDFGIQGTEGTALVISVERASSKWPDLVVSQRFDPGPESGFHPGTFLIPESHLILIGAGMRLLAYDLLSTQRVWEDTAEDGFWGWKRHGGFALMLAELEFAAWDFKGKRMWSTFVEPPWVYDVKGERIELDVMGERSSFAATTGPKPPRTS